MTCHRLITASPDHRISVLWQGKKMFYTFLWHLVQLPVSLLSFTSRSSRQNTWQPSVCLACARFTLSWTTCAANLMPNSLRCCSRASSRWWASSCCLWVLFSCWLVRGLKRCSSSYIAKGHLYERKEGDLLLPYLLPSCYWKVYEKPFVLDHDWPNHISLR